MAPGSATASACWSSRRPNRFSSGAAYALTPPRGFTYCGPEPMKRIRRVLLCLIFAPLIALLLLQAYFFVQIWWWVDHIPSSTSFMRRQLAVLREKNPRFQL